MYVIYSLITLTLVPVEISERGHEVMFCSVKKQKVGKTVILGVYRVFFHGEHFCWSDVDLSDVCRVCFDCACH
jgi:hypothetical protein